MRTPALPVPVGRCSGVPSRIANSHRPDFEMRAWVQSASLWTPSAISRGDDQWFAGHGGIGARARDPRALIYDARHVLGGEPTHSAAWRAGPSSNSTVTWKGARKLSGGEFATATEALLEYLDYTAVLDTYTSRCCWGGTREGRYEFAVRLLGRGISRGRRSSSYCADLPRLLLFPFGTVGAAGSSRRAVRSRGKGLRCAAGSPW